MKRTHNIIILILLSYFNVSLAQTTADKFSLAMNNYNLQRFANAHTLFNEIIEEYGFEDELYSAARYYSADALLKMGKKDEAASGFEFIVNNIYWSNFREEALYNLGLIYFDSGRYAVSRKRMMQLLNEYSPGEYTGVALYWIGESFSEEDRFQEAIAFLERAIEDNKANTYRDYAIYSLASVYEKTGDYKSAVENYDQLLSRYPDSELTVQAQVRIGICYFRLKDYHSSILELNNPVLKNLPGDSYVEGIYLLANSYYRVAEYENAEKTYLEIIDNFPGSAVVRDTKYGLAWAYFQQKKYSDAYRIFHHLSDGEDSLAIKSFIWKGETKRYAGQYSEAVSIFEEFLLCYPSHKLSAVADYQLGAIYFEQSNLELSERYLTTATSSPDPFLQAKAFTLLGEIELSNKNYLEAKRNFESVIRIIDGDNEVYQRALLGMGICLYHLKNYDEAIDYLKNIESLNPSFEQDRTGFYLAENYFSNGRYKEALNRYNSIQTIDKDISKEIIYGKAYCYFNLGDYESAAYQFSEFLERYPSDEKQLDAKLRLADSYFGSKNYVSASNVYKDIYKSDRFLQEDPHTYYQYAQALFKSGESNAAISEFKKLQQKFPTSKYAESSLYTVGWIKFQQGNFTEAIQDYRYVLSIYRNSALMPILYYSIGDAYFNLSQYDSAIVNYERVISRYPASSYVYDAVNGIQYSYVAMNQTERAVALIDNFIEQNPNLTFSDQVFFKKGEIYYSQRDYKSAKTSYQEFALKFPQSKFVPDAYYWIGKSAQNLEQNEEAIFHFNKVFEQYPNSEIASASVLEMGKLYSSLENFTAASQVYERASSQLRDSPGIPEILFLKGISYTNLNNVQKAYEVFSDLVLYHRESLFADKAKFEMALIDLAAERYETADELLLDISGTRTDELGAQAQYYYGLSLFEQERLTESISALVRIRTVYSTYDEWLARSYLLLGDCYLLLEDSRKAEEMYRVVLSKHRGDIFGQEAREKLSKL